MDKHKQTPDILAEILGGDVPNEPEAAAPHPSRPAAARPKRAPRPKPPATAKPKPIAPADWEYKVVSFQDYKGWRPRFVDGKELKNWMEGPLLHEYLAQLSAEGWELAAASSGERMYGLSDKHQLYFKHLK